MKSQREFPRLVISPKGTRWVEQGHPWIYEAEVVSGGEDAENGVLVDAVSEKGKYLGTGFLSRKSKIRVRLISRNANDRFDAAFWKRRIKYAWDYRKVVMGSDTGCCRVIFGEADGFPGLTVDRFSELLVVQTLSVGMERIKDTLFPLLAEVLREDEQDIRGILDQAGEYMDESRKTAIISAFSSRLGQLMVLAQVQRQEDDVAQDVEQDRAQDYGFRMEL